MGSNDDIDEFDIDDDDNGHIHFIHYWLNFMTLDFFIYIILLSCNIMAFGMRVMQLSSEIIEFLRRENKK